MEGLELVKKKRRAKPPRQGLGTVRKQLKTKKTMKKSKPRRRGPKKTLNVKPSHVEHKRRRRTKFCRYCGAEIPRASKYCQECGEQLRLLPTEKCASCGEEIPYPTAKFCVKCGTKLNKAV